MVTYMFFISGIGVILIIAGVIAIIVERRGDAAPAAAPDDAKVANTRDTPTTPAAGVASTHGH